MKKLTRFFLGALLAVSAFASNAAIYNLGDSVGPFNGGNLTKQFTSPGTGTGVLTFDLMGYNTVDGFNCCTDIFTLAINGQTLFQGAFDMGGGGLNGVLFQDPSVTVVSSQSFGFGQGGLTKFSVNQSVLAGVNTYVFDYGAMQGLGDEGWGVKNVLVDVTANNVPEPGSIALFGAALLSLSLVRRRSMK